MSSSMSESSKLGAFLRGACFRARFGGGDGGSASDSESDPESEEDIVEFQDVDTFACWKLGTWKTVPVWVFVLPPSPALSASHSPPAASDHLVESEIVKVECRFRKHGPV